MFAIARPMIFDCPQCGARVATPSCFDAEIESTECGHCGMILTANEHGSIVKPSPPSELTVAPPASLQDDAIGQFSADAFGTFEQYVSPPSLPTVANPAATQPIGPLSSLGVLLHPRLPALTVLFISLAVFALNYFVMFGANESYFLAPIYLCPAFALLALGGVVHPPLLRVFNGARHPRSLWLVGLALFGAGLGVGFFLHVQLFGL